MGVADLLMAGVYGGGELTAAADSAGPDDVAAVVALAGHADPEVREAVARELPLMLGGDVPASAAVDAVVLLTRDPVTAVRDWACFCLGEQWREVDTPAVRQALADRLGDEDDDTRCEALVGLAYRQDARALPAVRATLSRDDGDLFKLELVAAGALSDPGLHELVLRHLDGWDDDDRLVVDAVRRLTDPAGLGEDVLEGVADLYRRRVHGQPEGEVLPSWHQLEAVLEINPRLAPAVLDDVAALLADDPAAVAELRERSALAVFAEDATPA